MAPRPTLLAALVMLSAAGCQATVGGTVAPAAGKAPAAKATPKAGPSAKASAAPAGVARLQPPEGSYQTIAGSLKLDASWLVKAGGGTIYRRDGAPLVAAGGLNLIGNDGSTLIGNDGSTLIGNDGSTLIGNDGSTLIGNDGSTMVAAGGGNVVARAFALLAAPASVAYGTQLPAAIMKVSLTGLADGRPIPLGRTEGGEPATAIYTDLAGGFKLYVPPGATDYVRMVARPPGSDDPALAFEFLVDPVTGQAVVDEDRAILTGYLRRAFRARMDAFITREPDELLASLEAPGENKYSTGDGRYALIRTQIERFVEKAKARRLRNLPAADRLAIAQKAADTLLASCTFDVLDCNGAGDWHYRSDKKPLDELVAAFSHVRLQAVDRMAPYVGRGEDPAAAFPELAAAGATLRRPADLPAFLVERYLTAGAGPGEKVGPTTEVGRIDEMLGVLAGMGMLTPEDGQGRIKAAGYSLVSHMFTVFFFGAGRTVVGAEEYTGTLSPVGDAVFQVFSDAPAGPEVPAP